MTADTTMECMLEANYERFAALGVPRQADDIEVSMRYRQGLTQIEREMFDNLIRRGAFPGAAAESVEIASGRLIPHGVTAEAQAALKADIAA